MAARSFAWMTAIKKQAALKRVLLFLLALLCFMGSCAVPDSSGSDVPDVQNATSAGRTTVNWPAPTPDLTDAPGGDLRIWWPYRTNLNPLLETTQAGRAVYDLIYQGLFRITADERIEQDLANNLLVLDGGLQLLLAVEPGRTFHDGRPVTAADVAAALQYLIAPECQSIWRSGLEAIDSVQTLNEQVLEIRLNRPDPWLSWSLTFPVIPAEYVHESGFTLIPGSGLYAIEWYDPVEGLRLASMTNRAEPTKRQHILVRAYRNQQDAMQALERDELDLVLLDAQILSRYVVRGSLRVDHFSSEELFFISYNTSSSQLLHDEAALCLVKQVVSQMRDHDKAFSDWAEASPLGLTAVSWLNMAETVQPDGILAAEPAAWPDNADRLVLIAPQQDRRRTQILATLAEALEQAGILCTVSELEASLFDRELQAGRYDLALLSARLPKRPEPGFLISDPVPDVFVALDIIRPAAGGLAEAGLWQSRWLQLQPASLMWLMDADSVDPAWLQALTEAMTRSSWDSLCLLHMGLVYGDRVSGQCRPNRYHPYEKIEELWVWSGQSSSF